MQFQMQDAVVNNESYRSVFIYQFQYINIYMDSEKIINITKKKTKNNHRCFALCLVIRVHVVSFHISLQTYDHVHSMES